MANTIEAESFAQKNIKDQIALAADVAVGATSITLTNATQVANGDFLYLSQIGNQFCEKVSVTAPPTGNVVTISSTKFSHRKNEEVINAFGDQVQFLYASNVDGSQPDISSFQLLANVAIDTNDPVTIFTDTASAVATDTTARWYCYVYRNSATTGTTDITDAIAVRGGDYGHYTSISDIRMEAGFRKANYITDGDIDIHRRRAESTVNRYLSKVITLPLSHPLPEGIEDIARVLAAGYLMLAEYGAQADNRQLSKNGQAKVDDAIGQLKDIMNGNTPLVGTDGSNLSEYASYGSAYPDDTTDPLFTIDRVY